MSGSTKTYADLKIQKRRVMMFAKANDPDSHRAKHILDQYHLSQDTYEVVDIEKRQDCPQLENQLRYLALTDRRHSPYIFIDQLYFGSLFELNNCHADGSLKRVLAS